MSIRTRNGLTAAALLLASLLISAHADDDFDLKYSKFVLDNGLTLIVHEDHKAPIVAVNIWYHVGSKNEVPGRTGFAHLFEHLMFQGSDNFHGEYLSFLQQLGATDLNGTTWFDRTNYFQTVPRNALDTALWMESDRMGHFIDSVSQEKLDEQRGVVQNEKRQGENQPYGKVWAQILSHVFPPGHPYSWDTIGSMEDLNAASLDDVRHWFETYYGPNNAVLVIAGDIKPDEALEKVRHYFGDIPPGPPLIRPGVWIPRHAAERRIRMEDRVPQARYYKAWATPNWGSREAHYLTLAAGILAGGKNSRLYKRLVYDDQIATDVSLDAMAFEISGFTTLEVTVQPGVGLDRIEAAVNEEIDRLIRQGPRRNELVRVQRQHRTEFLQAMERVGGGRGKSATLAESMVYGGSPDAYRAELETIAQATRKDVQAATARWLGSGALVAEVVPYPQLAAAPDGADRSKPPEPAGTVPVRFPRFQHAQLDNGLKVIVATRPAVPLVNLSLVLDAGYAADQSRQQGTATLALAMLDEGTTTRSALEISESLDMLTASLTTGSNLDSSYVNLTALRSRLDESLEIFADVILNPVFPPEELHRVRNIYLAQIQQEKKRPVSMALRVVPRLLYGTGHAYARSLTGLGTEAELQSISQNDLRAFHSDWFHPGQGTLVVVGDTTMEEILPMIRKYFGRWQPADSPEKNIASVVPRPDHSIYLVDRPGSDQSVIFAGQLAPPKANPEEQAIKAMNNILGGMSSARINMNLREDKHWSYGAYSFLMDARGQRPLLFYAPVQTDRTSEAITEMLREIAGITGNRPPLEQELDLVKKSMTLSLPGRWETAASVLASISEIIRFGLPDDYWNGYADRINELTLPQITTAAIDVIHPDRLVWVVIGDRARIEPGLKQLGFDAIHLIDADGKPVNEN